MKGIIQPVGLDLPRGREHRGAARRGAQLPVGVDDGASAQRPFTVGNVSFSGVFLRGCTDTIQVGRLVTLELWLSYGGVLKRCGLKAEVVRRVADGAGMRFHKSDAVSFRYIHKLMYQESSPRRRGQ